MTVSFNFAGGSKAVADLSHFQSRTIDVMIKLFSPKIKKVSGYKLLSQLCSGVMIQM